MSWKTCTSCRKSIEFRSIYWECSVSTCNRKRMGLFFCSVGCWEAHLPTMRHREAWAVEKTAPSQEVWAAETETDANPRTKVVAPDPSQASPRRVVAPARNENLDDAPKDVLVVVSKLKKYVKMRSDMKTSDTVIPVLSDELRRICERAIRIAGQEGRKTIMDRDIREALK